MKLRPASRVPFRKKPCTERADAPRPARRTTEAYPPRYGEGGQRSRRGCSGTRMPGSEGMEPWTPVPPSSAAQPLSPGYESVRVGFASGVLPIYSLLRLHPSSRERGSFGGGPRR